MSRGTGLRPGRGQEAAGVTQQERQIIQAAFSNPLEIPPLFKGWLEAYLEPTIDELIQRRIVQIPGFAWPEWTAFTPTLHATGGDPTMGSGAVVQGDYIKLGNLVIYKAHIQFGTSGMVAGTGVYNFELPPFAAAGTPQMVAGGGTIYDSSANLRRVIAVEIYTSSRALFIFDNNADGTVRDALPYTQAAGDFFKVGGFYETA